MTISSYIIDNITIRPVNVISEAISIRDEMTKNAHRIFVGSGYEIEDIFTLQDMFGLHPLTVEAVLHENQPSKIDEYAKYTFAIIDGIAENRKKKVISKNNKMRNISSVMLIEDDLYMFLERQMDNNCKYLQPTFRRKYKEKN